MFKSLLAGAAILIAGAATFAAFVSPNTDNNAATIVMYAQFCKDNVSDKVKNAIVAYHEVRGRQVETEMLTVANQMKDAGTIPTWCTFIKPTFENAIQEFQR